MYNVSANFHTLAIQDAPTTRVRIYFIGSGVDCADDNDVQTNGTLLKWAVGDTDSNRRIGQDGIKFTEYFNPEYNVTIGRAVSSQIEMTLINTDGALNNFGFGRCKVYLDVYDPVNSTWLACPMGVYIIELPTQRRSKLIHAFGYDQMQKLDVICDSWWSGLNWSGGLTLLQIVNSMASQVGVSVSTGTASAIVNSSVTYTDAPFDCVEATYRDVLEYISEATGTIARFDRGGALDMRWFSAPTIGGSPVVIPTETSPNCCLGIDIAEYSVAPIDKLNVRMAEGAVSVNVGSGTNTYTILDNPFLNGDSATITARATPIYNRLTNITNYSPIQASMIWDWSLEAGDIVIFIANLGHNYVTPIFQQTMTWRGGFVTADVVNSGDPVRPVKDSASRDYYRMDVNMRTMTIDADRINLLGYTTINNGFKVNLDGTFEANGATIKGSFSATDTVGGVPFLLQAAGAEFKVMNNSHTMFKVAPKGNGTYGGTLTMVDGHGYGNIEIDGSKFQIIGQQNGGVASLANLSVIGTDPNNRGTLSLSGLLNGSVTVIYLDPTGTSVFDNDVSLGGDLSVTGDAAVTGDISAAGDITSNGQSVVLKKKDDASGSTYTISSNNYLSIPYPTGLNGNNVVSISLLDFGTVSGPITILPYGSTGSSWYMLGANGTSITAARFRYWYI